MSARTLPATCGYHGLVRDIEFYATNTWRDADSCPSAPTHYVCLRVHGVELLRNVCDQHCQDVRRLPDWCWSRPKTVTV